MNKSQIKNCMTIFNAIGRFIKGYHREHGDFSTNGIIWIESENKGFLVLIAFTQEQKDDIKEYVRKKSLQFVALPTILSDKDIDKLCPRIV